MPALCTNNDDILKVQGVSWMMRKAAGNAAPHLSMKHTTDPATGAEAIDIELVTMGQTRDERRVLDGAEKEVDNKLFGKAKTTNGRVDPGAGAMLCKCLGEAWLPESYVDGKIIHVRVKGDAGWVMEQVRTQSVRDIVVNAVVCCRLGASKSSTARRDIRARCMCPAQRAK